MTRELDWAIHHAARGYKVFPVLPGPKKIPALPDWTRLATTDSETLTLWWSGTHSVTNKKGKTWTIPKDSNIGILTTDHIVLDFDTKHGPEAEESLRELKRLGLPAPGLIVDTTTGGFHYYYDKFDDLEIKALVVEGQLLDGSQIDILAKLPSKEEAYGLIANVLQAPVGKFATLLNEVPSKLARVLSAVRDKKEAKA